MKKNERLVIHLEVSVTEYAPVKSHAQMSATYRELLEFREAYGQIRTDMMGYSAGRCQAVRAMPSEGLSLSDVGITFTGSS